MKRKPDSTIPLFDLKLSRQALDSAAACLKSGWLNTGPRVARFEKSVARRMKVRHAAAVSSATAGLQLILQVIGAGKGKRVITSPFTFVATVEAIIHTGARPVFVDIDPANLTIDPDLIERKMNSQTVAVLPVDIAGRLSDYQRLRRICNSKKLPLIADAAHSVSATWRGRSAASLADAAVLSFHVTKNLTCGEGGMVLSRHKHLIEEVRLLAGHGLTSAAYGRKQKGQVGYDALELGYKANMSELHAAIGLGQLEVLNSEQTKRERLAERYLSNLSHLSEYMELPPVNKSGQHGWHLFIIKLNLPRLIIDRDRFIGLMAKAGVECGVHYRPIFELTHYRKLLRLSDSHCPKAANAGLRVVSLPMWPGLKLKQVDQVCGAIENIVRRHSG